MAVGLAARGSEPIVSRCNVTDYELLIKRIGLTGLANLVVALSPVILLPILTKILTIQEYGIWSLILVTVGFVPMVVLLGLPNSMVRFLAPVKNKDEIREGYYSIALVVLSAGLVSSLFLLLFEHSIAAHLLGNNRTVALLLPLITFVAAYNYVPQTYFRTFQQAKRYSIVSLLQAALYVILVAAFVVVGLGLAGAAFAYLISLLVIALISTYYVSRDIGVTMPSFSRLKAYLKYGLPFVPSSVSSWALGVSDRYIITFFLGVAWVGYYSPGYQLGWTISLLATPFTILVPTALYEYYDAHQIAEVKTIIRVLHKILPGSCRSRSLRVFSSVQAHTACTNYPCNSCERLSDHAVHRVELAPIWSVVHNHDRAHL